MTGISPRDTGGSAPSSHRLWGIDWWPSLWATRIRILFVLDGRITTGHGPEDFGLGQVLDTLRASFAWWVRLQVHVFHRDAPETFTEALLGNHNFRFTQDGFDIDEYDQIWFFGDHPGLDANPPTVGDDIIDDAGYSPLGAEELRIIAEWMERGGGVFAAGDHTLLGASMCSRIPRVRNMRRWTRAQQVPSFSDEDRHETLVRDSQTGTLTWEGDRWPQQIWPVYRQDPWNPTFFHRWPHPILCGRTGVIDRFPDHMHEGAVIEDDQVRLDEPLGIPGFDGEEFPAIEPVFEGTAAFGPETFGVRPRPQVVAHGLTTNPDGPVRRFAMIGVYDGDPVGIGRVVVDSTWHHWFSMNLVGFQANAPGLYARMQDYYRNVALWLATPAQRRAMLFAAVWGVLVGKHPGAFDAVMGVWDLGVRVVDVIGRTAPQCIVGELVATFLRAAARPDRPDGPDGRRRRHWPPATMLNEAIVGGVALELLPLAHDQIRERIHGRSVRIDPDAIRTRGLEGVATGIRELVATLREGSSRSEALSKELGRPGKHGAMDIPVAFEPVEKPLE